MYAFTQGSEKTPVARSLLMGGGMVSVQVLNESVAIALRKTGMTLDDAAQVVAQIRRHCTILPITPESQAKAMALAERHQLHIYDANIWACAILAECGTLYSEDMHHGLTIEGTTLHNPFLS